MFPQMLNRSSVVAMGYNVLQLNDSFCFSQKFWLGAVSSSTVINHKCSFGELNLFLFFFERGQNIK
jgi:hypothetical protein